MGEELHRGLEGVLVTETELSRVDGEAGQLIYRGYPIESLAESASYEDVLYLLWEGELPGPAQRGPFESRLRARRELADPVHELLASLADAGEDPMAALRTAVSALSSTHDPDRTTEDPDHAIEVGRHITAKIPTVLASFERYRNGERPIAPDDDLGHAANFLYMLTGESPDPVVADTLDTALVLHADHGINASTFSAMVTASTLADTYAAVTSAIGTLDGPLHGGANRDVMQMLLEVEESDREPGAWVREAFAEGRRIPGFGHRVYEVKDPRAYILAEMSEALGEAAGDRRWYEYSVEIEETMAAETDIPPNVDFYSASTYYQMGIPIDLFTPLFAMSRVGGWVAHVREQYADNRIMRPRGRYVGPEDRSLAPSSEQ